MEEEGGKKGARCVAARKHKGKGRRRMAASSLQETRHGDVRVFRMQMDLMEWEKEGLDPPPPFTRTLRIN